MKIKIICFVLTILLTALIFSTYTTKAGPPKEDRLTQLEKRVTALEEWAVRHGGKIK